MAQTKKKTAKASKSAKTKKAAKAPKAMKKSAPAKSAKASAKASPAMKKSSSSTATPAKKISIPSAFKPLDDRLIILVEPAPTKTAGGLYIPDSAGEKPSRGTVLAAGPGRRNKKGVVRPLDVSVGDTILFPQYAGQKVEIGADEFLILREDEVLAITIS